MLFIVYVLATSSSADRPYIIAVISDDYYTHVNTSSDENVANEQDYMK